MAETPEDIIVDLWAAVYGEPPPVRAELSVMVGALVSGLPEPVWSEDVSCALKGIAQKPKPDAVQPSVMVIRGEAVSGTAGH